VRVSSEIAQSTFNKLYKALELNITGVSDTESNQNSRGPFTMIDPITITAP
jgi:hypothetical protein